MRTHQTQGLPFISLPTFPLLFQPTTKKLNPVAQWFQHHFCCCKDWWAAPWWDHRVMSWIQKVWCPSSPQILRGKIPLDFDDVCCSDFAVNFFHFRQNAASKKGHNKKKYINHPFTWPWSNHVASPFAISTSVIAFQKSTVFSHVRMTNLAPRHSSNRSYCGKEIRLRCYPYIHVKNASQSSQTCCVAKKFRLLEPLSQGFSPIFGPTCIIPVWCHQGGRSPAKIK